MSKAIAQVRECDARRTKAVMELGVTRFSRDMCHCSFLPSYTQGGIHAVL